MVRPHFARFLDTDIILDTEITESDSTLHPVERDRNL